MTTMISSQTLPGSVASESTGLDAGGPALVRLSRRGFLIGSGAASVGLLMGALKPSLALAQQAEQAAGFSPIAWVRLHPDNTATIYSAASEMGQGTMTALPMVLAEHMELDWSKVRVQQAPSDPKRFGNPRFGGGMTTGASRTVQGYYGPLSLAGLQGKMVMLTAAAAHWNVPVSELRAENSMVIHAGSQRQISYGELSRTASAPAELPKVDRAMLKPMAQFKIIGKDLTRTDLPAKTTGQAVYGIDVRLPGMLYASLLSAPVQGEKAVQVDDAAAKAVAGVKAVVTIPTGVAVVADSYYTARKARDLLKVEWSNTSRARAYTSDAALKEFVARAENLGDAGVTYHTHGDAPKELAAAARLFKATYTTEHVNQTTLEPMNTTARVDGDRIELWTPSQTVGFVVGGVAAAGGFKPENIKVNIQLLGGGYGRRVEAEYAVDAALIAKAVPGVAVQMIWSREDDFTRAKPRPATAQHLVASVDASGKLTGLLHRVVGEQIYGRVLPPPAFAAMGRKDSPVMEFAEGVYDIPGHLVQQCTEDRGIACSFWRGVGAGYVKFASETLLDEVATGTGQDPLQMRLALCHKVPRALTVLRETAAMAEWSRPRPAGRALGLAFSDAWNSFIAMIVEVSLQQGRPVVHKLWAAVDCGHAITPKNIQTQIEGSAIFGLSAVLGEKLSYVGGETQQKNLNTYPLLRAPQTPEVMVKVIPTDNYPGGIGEVGLPPVAPAVANAIARLTGGKRVRSLPFANLA